MGKTVEEIVQAIITKSERATLQRAVDRHIAEIDALLRGEGYRLKVFADAMNAAGYVRPGGLAMTDLYFGSLVTRARQRAAKKGAPQMPLAAPPAAVPAPEPVTLSPPPAPPRRDSAAPPQFVDVPSRSGRGMESLAVNRKKPPPGG